MTDSKILLYYAFAPVADPDAVRLWQRELCESLGLLGRIIVSPHGINGTVGGEVDACKRYLRRTRDYPPFSGLDAKWSDGSGLIDAVASPLRGTDRSVPWRRSRDFPKLSVKVREELVSFGVADELRVTASGIDGGGRRLQPDELHALVAARDDVVFFDGRNAYEAAIGRFRGAVVPEVRTTRDFIGEIDRGAFDELKHRAVVTYCTGGVRCEVLSAAMLRRGFTEVYQLDGGIVRYGEAVGNDGLWEGSLAVFDGRETVTFGPDAQVIGSCAHCGTPSSRLANCAEPFCRTRFVVCASHGTEPCAEHAAGADVSVATR